LTGCVFTLPGVFLAPVVGALADRFGRKRILVPSMMLFGVPGGASAVNILWLLGKEFSRWVIVANVIAWPIAYFVMKKWLQNFAYQTNIGLWSFVLAALLALIIALFTVSYQSVKAALTNPVDCLRYE